MVRKFLERYPSNIDFDLGYEIVYENPKTVIDNIRRFGGSKVDTESIFNGQTPEEIDNYMSEIEKAREVYLNDQNLFFALSIPDEIREIKNGIISLGGLCRTKNYHLSKLVEEKIESGELEEIDVLRWNDQYLGKLFNRFISCYDEERGFSFGQTFSVSNPNLLLSLYHHTKKGDIPVGLFKHICFSYIKELSKKRSKDDWFIESVAENVVSTGLMSKKELLQVFED